MSVTIHDPMVGDLKFDNFEPETRQSLEALVKLIGTARPTLRQIWAAMDFIWDVVGADNQSPSEDALARFYSHPVWLLNGLFIEQHQLSLQHRDRFAYCIAEKNPSRVADFGGGYGNLARKIAARCPDASVEIVDPYPRLESQVVNSAFENVSFSPRLSGTYDVIVATDVFEHVIAPIDLLFSIAKHVDADGYFLTANHFAPSIKCHLPRTFHLAQTWGVFMQMAGFELDTPIAYGQMYRKNFDGELDGRVRRIEHLSKKIHNISPKIRGFGWFHRTAIEVLTKVV